MPLASRPSRESLIHSAPRLHASALSSRRRQILSTKRDGAFCRYASGLSPREIQRIRANPGHLIESAIPLGFTSEHQLDYLWPPLLVIRFFQSIIVGQAFLVPGRLFYWRRGDAAMGIDRGALTFWCNRGRLEIQKSEPPRGDRSDVLRKKEFFRPYKQCWYTDGHRHPYEKKLFWSIASFFMFAT